MYSSFVITDKLVNVFIYIYISHVYFIKKKSVKFIKFCLFYFYCFEILPMNNNHKVFLLPFLILQMMKCIFFFLNN